MIQSFLGFGVILAFINLLIEGPSNTIQAFGMFAMMVTLYLFACKVEK